MSLGKKSLIGESRVNIGNLFAELMDIQTKYFGKIYDFFQKRIIR